MSMNKLFDELGYTGSSITDGGKELKLLVVNNPDGSIRWVVPATARKAYFLKFYNTSSLKAKLMALCFKLVFLLRLQHVILKSKLVVIKPNSQLNQIIDLWGNKAWAIFTGTPGPNNKKILYYIRGRRSFFVKFSSNFNSVRLIQNESKTIQLLTKHNICTFEFPDVYKNNGTSLTLTDISENSARSTELSRHHFLALQEISLIKPTKIQPFNFDELVKSFERKLGQLSEQGDERVSQALYKKLRMLLANLKEQNLATGLIHGDFTPWNTYYKNGQLGIYDWELSSFNVQGYDFFHFVIQKGILLERKTWKQIYAELRYYASKPFFSSCFPEVAKSFNEYLAAYLLFNTIENLSLFQKQEKWHIQVNWLLSTWNQAISQLLAEFIGDRKVLLIDAFSYFNKFEYAGIKVPNIAVDFISEESDVDLCIRRIDACQFVNYLQDHPLVAKLRVLRKSYMFEVKAILSNGQQLDFDLLWNLKVKELSVLSFKELLHDYQINDYGVKVTSVLNTARFIGLFYGINGASVPKKYNNLVLNLKSSPQLLDRIIFDSAINGSIPRYKLKLLKSGDPENSGINYVKNLFLYVLDTLKTLLKYKGFVVTFSGVDGAGKSTVIDNLKHRLEKKYRRRVVVLRHRPSLLPILSVWTKGKKKAQEDVINALPRQGNNKSTIGSLARFAYYYIDYLIGQFYVHIRYVSLGVVVLYDRYYFDFINDGKRSNINLPEKWVKPWYKLLLKPDVNFFLYAEPQEILRRKQELNEEDIKSLTSKYLNLFNSLNKGKSTRYIPVENKNLDDTLNLIEKRTALSM